jgi:hypothetical protein
MKFISIGPYCKTAEILKASSNKQESYPFDWGFSSLQMVKHCIDDSFKTFLDTSQAYDIKENYSRHKFYESMLDTKDINSHIDEVFGPDNKYIPSIFPHHNIITCHEAFKRRCERFMNAIEQEDTYFIYFTNADDFDDDTKRQVKQLLDLNCQILIFCIDYIEYMRFNHNSF